MKRTKRVFAGIASVTLVASMTVAFGGTSAAADRKAPKIVKAKMVDSDGDGKVNRIALTYSEVIRHRADRDGRYPFKVDGYTIKRIPRAKGTRKLRLILKEAAGPGAPNVSYRRGIQRVVKDRAGNVAQKQVFTDIIPLLVARDTPATVTLNPQGPGSIVDQVTGITCVVSCTRLGLIGEVLALLAVPDAGAVFMYWSGACTGMLPTCTLSLENLSLVTAIFGYPVEVAVSGAGTVSSGDGRIFCPPLCIGAYPAGSTMTLTASPSAGQTFSGWSGDCSGQASVCTLQINGPRQAGATFSGSVLPLP